MKRFTLKPLDFFSLVLAVEGLDWKSRSLLFGEKNSGASSEARNGTGPDGGFPPEFPSGFIRDMGFLRELDLAANPHRELCVRYCESVYSSRGRDRLLGRTGSGWLSGEEFLGEVSSFRYYRRFFFEPGRILRERLLSGGPGMDLPPPETFDMGKELLSCLVSAPGPLRFSAVAAAFTGCPLIRVAEALFACLHSAAAVLLWDKDSGIPLAGVWPHLGGAPRTDWTAAIRLESRDAPVREDFACFPPYFIEDLESVLLYAAFFGIKIRTGRRETHKKDREGILRNWREYPVELLRTGTRLSREDRLEEALGILLSRDFLLPAKGEARRRLVIGRNGTDWLRLSLAEKFSYEADIKRRTLLEGDYSAKAVTTVAELFSGGETFDAEDFLVFAVYRKNPFPSNREGPYDAAVESWQKALETVLFSYLLPLGGLSLRQEDRRGLISLGPAGRYLLRLSPNIPAFPSEVSRPHIHLRGNGRILVRTPGKVIDDKLSRFCDRDSGESVPGPEYRITGPSVLRAAAEGIPLEVLLYVLSSLSLREVPRDLEKAVRRWYSQAGRASILSGLPVDCGFPKWAKIIAASDPGHVRSAGGRFVLVDESLGLDGFSALCRRVGVVLTDLRNQGSRNNPGPSPPA